MARITLTTPLKGVAPLSEEQVVAAVLATGPKRRAFTEAVCRRIYRNCDAIGLRGDIWVTDAALETGNFASAIYEQYGNIGGLGVFDDGTNVGGAFASAEIAAGGFTAHAMAYVFGAALAAGRAWVEHDPRWSAAIDRVSRLSTIAVVGDLGNGNWATNPVHAAALVDRYAALFGPLTPTKTEEPVMPRPKILLIAGHRSYNDAGNPNEKARTPGLATAYYETLHDAGYEVWWLQRDVDGDADPDDTVGGLDTVSMLAYGWGTHTPGELVVLDLHYEGAYARGHFAIVPDRDGLGTAVNLPQPGGDTWAGNPLDRRLARVWADQVRLLTSLPYRSSGVKEPGLMSETQTGVGGQGWRLATFAYTAPHRDRMVRLVLEHGSLLMADDLAIINAPGFVTRCALAARTAIDQVYGVTAETPNETPEPTEPAPAEKHTLPAGASVELMRRYFKSYVAPWGETYDFDPTRNAGSQVWLARGKRSIPEGGTFEDGMWPHLVEVIRRGTNGDRGEVYRWSNGATYWSKTKQE